MCSYAKTLTTQEWPQQRGLPRGGKDIPDRLEEKAAKAELR